MRTDEATTGTAGPDFSSWSVIDDVASATRDFSSWEVLGDETAEPEKTTSGGAADPVREHVETVLKSAPEPTFWERIKEALNPLNDEARAKAFLAVANAEDANNALRQAGATRRVSPADFDRSWAQDFMTGLEGSVTGLMARQALPDGPPPEVEKYLSTGNRVARQAGTLLGDLPYMTMGMILGGGPESPTGWGGSFALPAGLRKVYMDEIEKGKISSWRDFSKRLGETVWEVLKGEAVGIATHSSGAAAGALRVPAEVAAMTSVSAGLEGRVPEAQEFVDAAILLGGAHVAGQLAVNLRTIYANVGKRPVEVLREARSDPSVRDNVFSSRGTPRAFSIQTEAPLEVEGATTRRSVYERSVPAGNTKGDISEQKNKGNYLNRNLHREGAEYDRHLPGEDEAPTRPAEPGEVQARAAVKKSEIIKALQEKLTAPIRSGRLGPRSKSVLGIYKIKPEVVRTRFANDVSTAVHEFGHHVHNSLWGMDKKALEPFRDELTPLATLGDSLEEGLAEFASLYVAHPAKAKARAPRFYDFWERELGQAAPDVLEALQEAQAAVDAWVKQPAEQKVLSSVSVNEKTRSRLTFDEVHSYLWDDLRYLDKAVRRITGKRGWYFGPFGKGEKLPASRDPYKLARALRGNPGRAEQWLYHSPYRFADYGNVGKPLAEVLMPVRNEIDAFRAYVISKRALELRERGMASGVDLAAARTTVEKWEGKFQKTFAELKEYQDHLLQYQRDAGLLSPEGYAAIKELNKDYVPFQRIMEGKKVGPRTGQGLEARNPTKRIKGSTRDIYDPLESIIKNTYVTLELSEKNAALRALTELAESKPGNGDLVERIPMPQIGTRIKGEEVADWLGKALPEEQAQLLWDAVKTGDVDLDSLGFSVFRPKAFMPEEDIISVWRGGKREFYQVSPELGRAIKALDRESTNMLVRFLSKPTEWLRAGATMSPDFLARNIFRDQLSATVFSSSGYKPFVDYTRGVFSALKADGYYQAWLKGGGASTFLHSMDRNYMQEHLGKMLHELPVWNKVNPFQWLRVLSEYSELGTRVGEARRVMQKAGTGREGAIEGGFAAREVSLDFSRAGSKGRFLNNIIAFFNASMQGLDKLGRKFREDPAGASARAFVSITLPSLLLAWHNRDNKKIQAAPRWQKDLFWLVDAGGVLWRIPKPFDLGLLFGTMPERIFDYVYRKDPKAMDDLMESLLQVSPPGMLPTALLPVVENVTGYSFFLGRDILPSSLEGRLPEYQYTENTLELTKWLSKAVGSLPAVEDMPMDQKDAWLPPAKVENLVRGWTGGLGYYALQLLDAAGRKAGILPDPTKPTRTLADLPVVKAFVARWPTANAQPISDFYEQYEELQRYWATAGALARGEFRADAEVMGLMGQGDYKAVKGFADALGNLRKCIEGIYHLPDLTPDKKRELIDAAYLQMLGIAQRGNVVMQQIQDRIEETQ